MRKELAKRVGRRGRFSATFERTGVHKDQWGTKVTMLFLDVRDEAGTVVADHIWFVQGKQSRELKLRKGERVKFLATVAPYRKRNPEREFDDEASYKVLDYRLTYPSNLCRLSDQSYQSLPLFSGEQVL